MAELFDDRPKRDSLMKDHPSDSAVTTPTSPSANNSTAQADETASMEQLELDLKSILSEISQLGQTSNNERETSWQNKKSAAAAAAATATGPSTMTPSVRLSTTPRVSTAVTTVEQSKEEEPPKPVPKFCHSCGSSYPERHTVKFCCQCGARRLYV